MHIQKYEMHIEIYSHFLTYEMYGMHIQKYETHIRIIYGMNIQKYEPHMGLLLLLQQARAATRWTRA